MMSAFFQKDYATNAEMEKLRSSKNVIDDKIKELELHVKKLEKERNDLVEEHEAIEVEREEELRALQNALDDALEQKIKIQTKYEKDLQKFKSNCSAQEQQLMDDFEWKLRQVEQSWKKKIQEKEKQVNET
jgi:chromosome segregation ATPase